MKFVQQAGDDANAPASLTLDCPLCANLGAPPPWLAIAAAVVFHPAYALGPAKGAPRASLPRDPWQARAPPAYS